jgi:glycosyltransferase involved in cell wall biosynthesis
MPFLGNSFNFVSGYNTLSETILNELPKKGIEVLPVYLSTPTRTEENLKYFNDKQHYDFRNPELVISPGSRDFDSSFPIYRLSPHKNRSLFTMWESTAIAFPFVEELNKCKCVIVPNKWNAYHFKRCGVHVPIKVLPLFVDTKKFCYQSPNNDETFIFGTANGDPRKRIEEVIRCFLKAFPKEKDVKLKVKISKRDNLNLRFLDKRVEVIDSEFTQDNLVDWYHSLDLFVSGVSAEGWGFMQHEAMACGRPVIAAKYAGLEEFFDETVGYPVEYTEVPSEGYWDIPGGRWSKFDESDMITVMRYCYNNRAEITHAGHLANERAIQFSKDKFLKSLIQILEECQ